MLDSNDLLRAIQKAATEAVEAGKPTAFTYGRVISDDPLMVEVDQKIQLGENQLVRGESLQEYEGEVEVELEEMELELELETEDGPVQVKASGKGKIKGRAKMNRLLEAGTEVILARIQGGQNYILYDKVKTDGQKGTFAGSGSLF